jgi:hypothetical protein
MTTCAVSYYTEPDQRELVDIDYQCSVECMLSTIERETGLRPTEFAGEANLPTDEGSISWGRWPGGAETDYDVHCSTCEDLLWRGLSSELADDVKP